MLQWSEEIERHVEPGRLKWCRYVPPGAAALAAQLLEGETGAAGAAERPQRRSRRVAEASTTVRRCWDRHVRCACCVPHWLQQRVAPKPCLVLLP